MEQGVDSWWVIGASLGLGVLPLALVMTTCYTKVSIVLALLRNALGVQQVPSNLALSGIALAITMLVMAPVAETIGGGLDVDGMLTGTHFPSLGEMVDAVRSPIERFMLRYVDASELDALRAALGEEGGDGDVPRLSVLVPAFVVSEVASAFKIGMYLALGFAVVDLIVANLTMAMGMTMFPPTTLSIPLKLLVFVATAGFSRTVRGLIQAYAG